MSATNALETALLELLFKNTDAANIGDTTGLRGSTTPGNFYISLHTAIPDETGTQATSEANYEGYERVAVARSGSGWSVSGDTLSNAAAISFDPCTNGNNVITHFGIGSDLNGAGHLFIYGTLTTPLTVTTGVVPSFGIGTLQVTLA